jgi:hypothetical protein
VESITEVVRAIVLEIIHQPVREANRDGDHHQEIDPQLFGISPG